MACMALALAPECTEAPAFCCGRGGARTYGHSTAGRLQHLSPQTASCPPQQLRPHLCMSMMPWGLHTQLSSGRPGTLVKVLLLASHCRTGQGGSRGW